MKHLQAVPSYRVSNPKIALYNFDELRQLTQYKTSTNHFRTCRDALEYFRAKYPEWELTSARRDTRR